MKGKVFLSDTDKKISGVCGGIGERFNTDPTVIRVLFVILFILFKLPVLGVYILLWAILPKASDA